MAAVLIGSAGMQAKAQDATIFTGEPGNCPCGSDFLRGAVFGQTFTTPDLFTYFTGFTYRGFVGNPGTQLFVYMTALVQWDPIANRPIGGLLVSEQNSNSSVVGPAPHLETAAIILNPNMMYLAMVDLSNLHYVDGSPATSGIELVTTDDRKSTYAGGDFVRQNAQDPNASWGLGAGPEPHDLSVRIGLSVVPSPEPATLALVAPGIVGLGVVARKRRRR